MKIVLTGSRGIVGHRLVQDLPRMGIEIIEAPSLRTVDADFLRRWLEDVRKSTGPVDGMIHTAAISDIGTCEKDPEASFQANVLLPTMLASICEENQLKLAAFSSDQVYSGLPEEGPYSEEKVLGANTYARHKIEMEQRVLAICPSAVLLRAEWMYDVGTPRGNFVMNLLSGEGTVYASKKQYRGVTYLREVAEAMPRVLAAPGGVYNFGSETDRNHYEVTCGFLEYIGKTRDVTELDRTPHNLWMDCTKARLVGIDFSSVLEGAKRCARDYGLQKTDCQLGSKTI